MTHMDDQVAKHIEEIISSVARKAPESLDEPSKPDTLK